MLLEMMTLEIIARIWILVVSLVKRFFQVRTCFLEVRLVLIESSVRVTNKNGGTIVVLNRYVAALCFLEVLEMVVR